ncbi:MAG: NADH-quinone oxidoreductase subunit J [Desulfobulbaceae bacterium]|nr:NADH-quinone oxidoreductase subunit J [Desulfobulbaceae bacterium]
MTLYSGFFYLLAVIITVATALTITSRNLVYAVIYLVISFLGTALLFYLLGAPMLAALEAIIYAGAIMVLFLMIIMLIQVDEQEGVVSLLNQCFFVIAVIGTTFSLVMLLLYANPGSFLPLQAGMVTPRQFGAFIFQRYWLAVEVVSFLLLVALVGALFLSRSQSKEATYGVKR